MPIPTLKNIDKKGLNPWNTQRCWDETGNVEFKENSTFVMDEIACMAANLTTAITGGSSDDTVKDVQTYLMKADKANPVASATLPASQALAIDIENMSFEYDIRVKVVLETGSGDVDRYFVVTADTAKRATFNSDTIKSISMDVPNGSIISQATAAGLNASALAVHDGASFPASTEVVANITVLNA